MAIKVLPASVASDADRLARFQREAEVLAALNHPNIGAIYGLEKTPDFTALVMELVEGDGTTSGFVAERVDVPDAVDPLQKVAVVGGVPIALGPAGVPLGASWADGQILFSTAEKGIARVSENAGAVETLVATTNSQRMQSPQLLPGGDALPFCGGRVRHHRRQPWDSAEIVVHSLKTGQRKTLITAGTDPHYLRTGHIVYAVGGILFAVPFNVRRLERGTACRCRCSRSRTGRWNRLAVSARRV